MKRSRRSSPSAAASGPCGTGLTIPELFKLHQTLYLITGFTILGPYHIAGFTIPEIY